MKIALCLHGYFNSLTDSSSKGIDGYDHIKRHILCKGDVDIFIHSWDIENSEKIINLYSPKKFIIENLLNFDLTVKERKLDTLRNTPRSPSSVLAHLYSVTQSIKLAYNHNDYYDIIIKCRFDVGRINRNTTGNIPGNPEPVQCINFITDIESEKIYMAEWNHFHMGPADMWFYGDYHTMNCFTTLYDDLNDNFYLNKDYHYFATSIEGNPGDLSNSIAFYKYWMMKNNLWNRKKTLKTTWE